MYSGCGVGLTDTQTLVLSWQVDEESESHLSIRGYEAGPAVSFRVARSLGGPGRKCQVDVPKSLSENLPQLKN